MGKNTSASVARRGQGKRFCALREQVGGGKVRLASPDHLFRCLQAGSYGLEFISGVSVL